MTFFTEIRARIREIDGPRERKSIDVINRNFQNSANITRQQINEATERFLAEGGEIERHRPDPSVLHDTMKVGSMFNNAFKNDTVDKALDEAKERMYLDGRFE